MKFWFWLGGGAFGCAALRSGSEVVGVEGVDEASPVVSADWWRTYMSGLQPFGVWDVRDLGRCPRLVCVGPLALIG